MNGGGSWEQRRRRPDHRSNQSSQILEPGIVQGLGVVKRVVHALDDLLRKRPKLAHLIASQRLPPDYLDKLFPGAVSNMSARKAERGHQLNLGQLVPLSPTAVAGMNAGMPTTAPWYGFVPPRAAPTSPWGATPPHALPLPVAPFGQWPAQPNAAPPDPAVLAQVMMQAVNMHWASTASNLTTTAQTAGLPSFSSLPAHVTPSEAIPKPSGQQGTSSSPAQAAGAPRNSAAPHSVARSPKPSLQAARMASQPSIAAMERNPTQHSPFLNLLDDFCTMMMQGDERGSRR
eukprot:TRINITY_DN27162_c0_g1_i1.p1 TRINITY_DN27162_c0_g1~~TRINITY_DN27162_c0_g1_i1.p1  ORF type:complete len:288 (-),score=42.30 TRINITY_DN27162_c0_g1_i1:169-1032(-)